MDWLNDKKNQPIVAAIAIVVIVVVGFCLYWFNFRQPPPDTSSTQTAQQTTTPDASQPNAQPPDTAPPQTTPTPTQPGTATAPAQVTPAAGTGAQVAKVTPMETWRSDPFQPIGYKPRPDPVVTPPIRDLFPSDRLFPPKPKGGKDDGPREVQQPSRRMAGILLGDRVYAIIETNGIAQVVQPGDYTTDRLAVVERIEPGKVVLKTVDEKPRYVAVRMAASPVSQTVTPSQPTGPGQPNFPGPPGIRPPNAPPPPGGGPPGGRPGEMP